MFRLSLILNLSLKVEPSHIVNIISEQFAPLAPPIFTTLICALPKPPPAVDASTPKSIPVAVFAAVPTFVSVKLAPYPPLLVPFICKVLSGVHVPIPIQPLPFINIKGFDTPQFGVELVPKYIPLFGSVAL